MLGVRFYKGTGNTGTHTGSLWSSTGLRLATGTFTGETSSGWQTLTFAVTGGRAGRHHLHRVLLRTRRPLRGHRRLLRRNGRATTARCTPSRTAADGPNGVYRYGGGFPTSSYNAGNYWVDVIYTPANTEHTSNIVYRSGATPASPDSDHRGGRGQEKAAVATSNPRPGRLVTATTATRQTPTRRRVVR